MKDLLFEEITLVTHTGARRSEAVPHGMPTSSCTRLLSVCVADGTGRDGAWALCGEATREQGESLGVVASAVSFPSVSWDEAEAQKLLVLLRGAILA
jgi:hypothetical protein